MTTPSKTIWPLDPHTKAKHEILSHYLKAWFPILGRYNGRIIYVDGFAGPGLYKNGEPGSPIIALNIARDAKLNAEIIFHFVEENEDRFQNLEQVINEITWPSSFRIDTVNDNFPDNLTEILDYLNTNNLRPAPIFAFIDPFGFKGVPFELVRKLLTYKKCEVFINFMVDSINRWITHPKEEIRNHIHTLLGMGKDKIDFVLGSEDRIMGIKELYKKQLKTAAKFVLSFEMKNKKDRTTYFLFFASNHRSGFVKMKESMWKIDENGDFTFSDATYRRQTLFNDFDMDEKIRELLSEILQRFGKQQNVLCSDILRFVEEKTIFLEKHMRIALSSAETARKISVRETKSNRAKRRKGTFPHDVIVDFL